MIQTIGRAARHLKGAAILYADRMTDSMKRAISETERRREKQIQFNTAHGISPKGVSKRIRDIIDGVYDQEAAGQALIASQDAASYAVMNEKQLTREIKRLEKEMTDYARDMAFEKAAETRDMLFKAKERLFGTAAQEHDAAK